MHSTLHFQVSGKLIGAAEASQPTAALRNHRVFVSDVRSGRRFLIDSGADISVLPPSAGRFKPTDKKRSISI